MHWSYMYKQKIYLVDVGQNAILQALALIPPRKSAVHVISSNIL